MVYHEGLYQTLDKSRAEIRLFILPDSVSKDGSISGCFRTVSLDESPEFYALSYVWGDPAMTQRFFIDSSEVFVTPNLENIIRLLLSHEHGPAAVRGKAIWIDALCINQKDMEEKEQQIPLMGQIYRQAARVLMWLGDADEHTDWAMACMNDADFYTAASTLKKTFRSPTADEITLKLIMEENLEQRTYWTRVWIAQEMVLATADPLVLCGSRCVPWTKYVNLLQWLPVSRGAYPEMMDVWNRIRATIPKSDGLRSSCMHRILREGFIDLGQDGMALAATLNITTTLGATNPKDFVFGCLGILRPEDSRLIRPNYSQSLAEVFKEAFRIVWVSNPNLFSALRPFSFHRSSASPIGLPSWTPDLSNQLSPQFLADYAGISFTSLSDELETRSSWRSLSRSHPTLDNDSLYLHAIEFDELEKLKRVDFNYGWEPAFPYVETHEEMIAPLRAAEAMLEEGRQRHISDQDKMACFQRFKSREPLWKTMSYWSQEVPELPETQLNVESKDQASSHESVWRSMAHARKERVQLPDLGPGKGMSNVERERTLLWEILMQRQVIPGAWKEAVAEEVQDNELKLKATVLNRLLHDIRKKSNERNIFLTRKGFFGLATLHVEDGDVVVFAAGLDCPLVLRPFLDGYQMKGFANISGLTSWDCIDECVEKGVIQPKTLKIY